MKQVVFAIALLAMASLTGCLDTDDTSVDENTDTTSDNTGNTNQDGTIDPVGTDGVTIPEDSSIFIDSPRQDKGMGTYECSDPRNGEGHADDEENWDCEYTYFSNDFFENMYNSNGEFYDIKYRDSDGIFNQLDFNGWVNKTGDVVTIETLVYPDRGPFSGWSTDADLDGDGAYETVPQYYQYVNQPVGDKCYTSYCSVTFYGHGGLQFNGDFYTSRSMASYSHSRDSDNDGVKDSMIQTTYYQRLTVTFDLPFEPYGFTISYYSSSDYQPELNRIF